MRTFFVSNDELRRAVDDYAVYGARSSAHATYGPIESWDVSCITDMARLFANRSSFTADLRHWDVSAVVDMRDMFSRARLFTSDLSRWQVGRVTDMSGMFEGATSFTCSLDAWDVSRVTTMESMFECATSFASDLSDWNVSNVTSMACMFVCATSFKSDLSRWDMGRVADACCIFDGAVAFHPPLHLRAGEGGYTWTIESLRRHRAHWRWARVRNAWRTLRPIVLYWLERTARKVYGPSGVGRQRDRFSFCNDCRLVLTSVAAPGVR